MKLSLKMCADTLDEFRAALKTLANSHLDSNACGVVEGAFFDYTFVDSNDVYSDDSDLLLLDPNTGVCDK